MPEGLRRLIEPFTLLSPGKQMLVAGVAFLSAIAFAVLIFVTNRTEYRPLFTNLASEDAGEIVKKLKESKTPYQITSDGKGVLVPSDKVYELRLTLASEGIPQGAGVGFELFDRKMNFGITEFAQKLNYLRALQGELSRTISQLVGVEQARVHLVIPEKSLFKDNEKPATASIVIKMKSNRSLRDSEVQGVIHLVSASIEGLEPEHVTVLDNHGKILSKGGSSDPTSRMTSAMQETQRAYEKNVEERIQSLLDRIVGGGKSVARVTAVFDFKHVERVEEKFDPESIAVRSEQRTEEKGASGSGASGAPGVQTNLARTNAANASSASGGSKNDETLNYEVSRSTAKIIEPVGALSKISVAVLVDGKYETPVAVKEGQAVKAKYIPRSPDELQKIETLVRSAVGFSTERGDQLSVQNIPFQDTGELGATETATWWTNPFFISLAKNLTIGIGFLALIMFVIRPLLISLRVVRSNSMSSIEPIGEGTEQLSTTERAQLAIQLAEQQDLIEQAKKDPYQVAQILQNWVAEDK
ncbi:MAG: flagellar basal-body MS-ring/collar protein FliF [Desulfuromonadales bacterium]